MEDWLDWLMPICFMYYPVGLLFKQVFTDVYILGDILINLWDYDNMTLNKCLGISLAWFIGVQLLLFISMYPWSSRLTEYSTTDDYLTKISKHNKNLNLLLKNDSNSDLINPIFETFDGIGTSRNLSEETSSTYNIPRNTSEKRFSLVQRFSQSSIRLSHNRTSYAQHQTNAQRGSINSNFENRESYFDISRKIAEDKRTTFCFQNIKYTIPVKAKNTLKVDQKQLLSNISGVIRPGEMMALMV